MLLKYVGPKPIISHTGIEFDNNKEDKFAYLNIVMQLLDALDHEYIQDKIYTYDICTKRIENDELFSKLQTYCPKLEKIIAIKAKKAQELIHHDLQRAKESETITDEDKEALRNNILMMKEYIIQREVNKGVYYCTIETLANLLKKDNIDYVIAPMFQKFAHVLHSVQGVLLKDEFSIETKLDIYQEDEKLLVKLKVVNSL